MPATQMDTRQNILDTARRIVAHKGFSAVGLNEVLGEAGVPKGSFYHYFRSKNVFGEAMLASYFEDYLATMDRILGEADRNSAERLMRYWEHFYAVQSADDFQGGCLVVKLAADVSDLSEMMRTSLKDGTDAIVDRIEQTIISGLADGSLSVGTDPRATAESLYQAWLGASLLAKVQRSPGPLDRVMTSTRQLLHLP